VINYFPAKILMQAQSGMPGNWMCFEQTSKFLELFLWNSAFRSFCSEVIFLSRRYFAAGSSAPLQQVSVAALCSVHVKSPI